MFIVQMVNKNFIEESRENINVKKQDLNIYFIQNDVVSYVHRKVNFQEDFRVVIIIKTKNKVIIDLLYLVIEDSDFINVSVLDRVFFKENIVLVFFDLLFKMKDLIVSFLMD